MSHKLAALEHEMAKKFGKEVVKHLRADWTIDDEANYIEQTTQMNDKFTKLIVEKSYSNKKGYLVSKKLLNDSSNNQSENCPYCDKYSFHFNVSDDINMNRYGCCRDCFYQHIEGREERWNEGWRPKETA